MKAFVAGCNEFLPAKVGETLKKAGYDVYGSLTDTVAEPPSWLQRPQLGPASLTGEHSYEQQAAQACDVVVYSIHGHEQQCIDAVIRLAGLPALAEGKERVFIGISTPLAWAKTPIPAGQPRTAEAAETEADEAEPSVSEAFTFTEQHAEERQPAACAVAVCEAEHVILRAARKGRLRTHVICPGLVYGMGEWPGGWQEQFKAAWEALPDSALPVYGSGANIVPTIHVADLAAYVTACATASEPDIPPYILAADQKLHSLREVVTAISARMGSGLVCDVSQDELFFTQGIERYLLDLPMAPTQLPTPVTLQYSDGMLANLDTVAQQFVAAKRLAPVKVLLAGPPAAGKTFWADKLAREYGLRRFDAKAMLAAADELGPAFKQELQAELSGKAARASDSCLARLTRHLLTRLPERNRGYVLDGWPKTPEQAEALFSVDVPYTEEELKAWEAERAAEAAKGVAVKPGAKAPAAPPKGGKAAGVPAPPKRRAVQQELLPDIVFQLDAPEEVLLGRVQEMAEAEAAAAPPPPAPPIAVKGAKPAAGPTVPLTHNNEQGFRRRYAAYSALHAGDGPDLQRRQEAANSRWEEQKKVLEAKAQAEADAAALADLRQRRRSTLTGLMAAAALKVASSTSSGMGQSPSPARTGSSLQRTGSNLGATGRKSETGRRPSELGTLRRSETGSRKSETGGRRSTAGSRRASASGEPATPPTGPAAQALQKHLEAGPPQLRFGGLLGYLEEAGSRIVTVGGASPAVAVSADPAGDSARIEQPQADDTRDAGAQQVADQLRAMDMTGDSAAASSAETPASSPDERVWSQLVGALGVPHNFDQRPGNPPEPGSAPMAALSTSEVPAASSGAAVGQAGTAAMEDPLTACSSPDYAQQAQHAQHANVAMWEQDSTAALRFQSEPLRRLLMQDLAPELTAVLLEVAASRPADPIKLIAERLIKAGKAQQQRYVDPYAADVYAAQKQKWLLKQQREALL